VTGPPKRLNEPRLAVRHADLKRVGNRAYASECVHNDCEGLLLVVRHHDTMELEAHDRCCLCGQPVCYIDIDEMQKREQ
jgi:hypothetical protein